MLENLPARCQLLTVHTLDMHYMIHNTRKGQKIKCLCAFSRGPSLHATALMVSCSMLRAYEKIRTVIDRRLYDGVSFHVLFNWGRVGVPLGYKPAADTDWRSYMENIDPH